MHELVDRDAEHDRDDEGDELDRVLHGGEERTRDERVDEQDQSHDEEGIEIPWAADSAAAR
jgi:hypothetical protein